MVHFFRRLIARWRRSPSYQCPRCGRTVYVGVDPPKDVVRTLNGAVRLTCCTLPKAPA
jgi:hypothetical protein